MLHLNISNMYKLSACTKNVLVKKFSFLLMRDVKKSHTGPLLLKTVYTLCTRRCCSPFCWMLQYSLHHTPLANYAYVSTQQQSPSWKIFGQKNWVWLLDSFNTFFTVFWLVSDYLFIWLHAIITPKPSIRKFRKIRVWSLSYDKSAANSKKRSILAIVRSLTIPWDFSDPYRGLNAWEFKFW